MKSQILQELEDNIKEIKEMIDKQLFSMADAEFYLRRYMNIVRAFEDLSKSRDNWRYKYEQLKKVKK